MYYLQSTCRLHVVMLLSINLLMPQIHFVETVGMPVSECTCSKQVDFFEHMCIAIKSNFEKFIERSTHLFVLCALYIMVPFKFAVLYLFTHFQPTLISALFTSPIDAAPSISCCQPRNSYFQYFFTAIDDSKQLLNSKACSSSRNACESCGGAICTNTNALHPKKQNQQFRRMQLVEDEEEQKISRCILVAATLIIVLGILGYVLVAKYFKCPSWNYRRPFFETPKDGYSEVGEHFESWEMEIDHDVLLL